MGVEDGMESLQDESSSGWDVTWETTVLDVSPCSMLTGGFASSRSKIIQMLERFVTYLSPYAKSLVQSQQGELETAQATGRLTM